MRKAPAGISSMAKRPHMLMCLGRCERSPPELSLFEFYSSDDTALLESDGSLNLAPSAAEVAAAACLDC